MNPIVLKRLTNRRVNLDESQLADFEVGGERPVPSLSLDAEIISNACEGVLLQYRATNGSFSRSLYQRSVVEAEQAAKNEFGIRHDEWHYEQNVFSLPVARVRKPSGARPPAPLR